MWILTVVLLMATGDYAVVSSPTYSKDLCLVAARDALALNEVGFNVLAASCSRAKEG